MLGCIRLSLKACKPAAQVHCYEVHGRFGHLVANSIPARLQLAALYAATSTLLPEPRSCMTGAQTALELVRQVSNGGLGLHAAGTQLKKVC